MTASITADYISSQFIGIEPVFQFDIGNVLPQNYYWMIVVLGVILGCFGAFYNWFTLTVQAMYKKVSWLNEVTRLLIPFTLAGIFAFTVPELLGSGHELIDLMTDHKLLLGGAIFLLAAKFVFSAVCFGSGAPGGIFFPLLVLGALTGGIFGMIGVNYFGMDPDYINNFVLLAMTGYFTAIVRAPLTGIILIFEMTGPVSQMLSLSIISIVAYIVATLLKSDPIYESLLERLLAGRGELKEEGSREKVLMRQSVMFGSAAADHEVGEIQWPDHCLLVSIQRSGREIIPRGNTMIRAGDVLVTMTEEQYAGEMHDEVREICEE